MADKKEKIDFALTSYILGIVSIVTAVFQPLLGIILGIIGLIQSNRQKTNISRLSKKLNIIGIVVGVVLFAVTIILLLKQKSFLNFPIA